MGPKDDANEASREVQEDLQAIVDYHDNKDSGW